LLKEEEKRKRLGNAARTRAEAHFNIVHNARATQEVYVECLKNN